MISFLEGRLIRLPSHERFLRASVHAQTVARHYFNVSSNDIHVCGLRQENTIK
jgi:hypothetical protein